MADAKPQRPHLIRELGELCRAHREGSFATQAARQDILVMAGRQLIKDGGFRDLAAGGLKQKHWQFLLNRWQSEGLSASTLKNRMSHLRWWAAHIGKQNLIPRTNGELGIDRRRYVTGESKARELPADALAKVNERLRVSLQLQEAFGLRREECLKFQPAYALDGKAVEDATSIRLKASWCKGGRAREMPITNAHQREMLAKALAIAGTGSMIDPQESYKQALKRYENTTHRAGLSKLHGLRHRYAQRRYEELTGWKSPAAGGPTSRQLTPEQKAIDQAARMEISNELGHGREQITAVYLGR